MKHANQPHHSFLRQFEYTLTVAVCTRTGEKDLQILKKFSQQVRQRLDRGSFIIHCRLAQGWLVVL